MAEEADVFCRGPEVELWLGAEEGSDPATENDWGLYPHNYPMGRSKLTDNRSFTLYGP